MNKRPRRQNSPFLVADMLQPTSSMRPLIRLLAAQAVRNWQEQAQNNDKILHTGDKDEGSDLREI